MWLTSYMASSMTVVFVKVTEGLFSVGFFLCVCVCYCPVYDIEHKPCMHRFNDQVVIFVCLGGLLFL